MSNVINAGQRFGPQQGAGEKAIATLGYAQRRCQNPEDKTPKHWGIITSEPYFPDISRGVEDAASRLGYSVFLCNGDRDPEKEMYYIRCLSQKSIDGIILVKCHLRLSGIAELYRQERIVLMDCRDELPARHDYNVLEVDDFGGFWKGMQLLHGLGHRRIAFIMGRIDARNVQRLNAYASFVREYRLDNDPALVFGGNFDWQSGYQCTKSILSMEKRPTAVFAANDLMAIGAMKAIREAGLSIPEDISLMGCDDIDMAQLCSPGLSTVQMPRYEVGSLCVEMLVDRLNGRPAPSAPTRLDAEIIRRESVGPAANA